MVSIRVQIPFHLQTLAQVPAEVSVEVSPTLTARSVVAALEAKYPALAGAIVDPHTGKRRPLVRFYVCKQDWTFEAPDKPLPSSLIDNNEPFIIIGAISGG
jgi:molybdopterin synthase sulfur carrier subunit